MTALWADGINRTPALLFTYNPAFRTDRKSTMGRKGLKEHLNNCLREYGIDQNRIYYVGNAANESRTYVPESASLIRQWAAHYQIDAKKTIILTDNGKSYFEEKEDVFARMGFKAQYWYTAAVHAFLSPNDNKFHGQAKRQWLAEGLDYSDDVKSSISLLFWLDQPTREHILGYFHQNFLLRVYNPTPLDSMQVITRKGSKPQKYFKRCLEEYKSAMSTIIMQ